MDIKIEKTITEFYELEDMCWSGALDTLHDIANADKETEFMNFLEMIYDNGEITDTELNDFIWFEREYIYENMGLDENGEEPSEEPSEEDIEKSIENLKSMECFEDFCDDCDTCVLDFCKTLEDCVNTFNDYKNGKISIDDII